MTGEPGLPVDGREHTPPEPAPEPAQERGRAPARSGSPPSARTVRKELRARRRAHSDQTFVQAFEQLYLWLFGVLMVGSMAGVTIRRLVADLDACTSSGCLDARATFAAPLGIAVLALTLRGLVAVGPLVSSRAGADWLLATPVDRRGLLLRPMTALAAGGAAVGAAVLSAVAALAAAPNTPATSVGSVGTAAMCGAGLGLIIVAAATIAQPAPPVRRLLITGCDVVLVLATAVVPLHLIGAGPPAVGWNGLGPLAAALLLVPALLLTVVAYRRLGRMPRRELVAGGGFLAGVAGAAAAMDTSLLSDLLNGRRFQRLGARTTRRGRGRGPAAIAVRETLRWLRSPHRIVIAAGLLVVPYVVARLDLPSAVPLATAVAGYLAIRPLGGGLHVVSRSAGLRRALPYADVPLRIALSAPMLPAAALWCLGAVPALLGAGGSMPALLGAGGSMPVQVASVQVASGIAGSGVAGSGVAGSGVAGSGVVGSGVAAAGFAWLGLTAAVAAGVSRSVTRRPVSFDGPLISTPAGALPAGFVGQLFRGPDFLLIGVIPLALGFSGPLALVVPLVMLVMAIRLG